MSLLDGSSMYNQPGMYNQGGGGSVVEYEKVFHTRFNNLSGGVDTPIIGSAYSTPLTQVTAVTTPLQDVTTVGSVNSSPAGEKKLVDLSSYIQGKKRAVLKFLVKIQTSNSYATIALIIHSPQLRLPPSNSVNILLMASNTSNVFVRNNLNNNTISFLPFSQNYSSDRWMDVQLNMDFEAKKYDVYLYGIKAYTWGISDSNLGSLPIIVSLWDGVTLYFTNVELWTK